MKPKFKIHQSNSPRSLQRQWLQNLFFLQEIFSFISLFV